MAFPHTLGASAALDPQFASAGFRAAVWTCRFCAGLPSARRSIRSLAGLYWLGSERQSTMQHAAVAAAQSLFSVRASRIHVCAEEGRDDAAGAETPA